MRERSNRSRKAAPKSHAGSLLLAHPSMRDPNFRRTVILMSVHNAETAMGVVLNRPLGRRLGEFNGDFSIGPLASVPVYQGGPVQAEQMLLVAWEKQADGIRVHFGLEPDRAIQLAGDGRAEIRAFLGYSGWAAGQLERELRRDTWVVAPTPDDLLSHPQDESLWRRVLGGISLDWRLLADEPEDSELN
ncbi:MAG TPA: YqgE/AlgH family protein [Opitutaceae bacterium]|nr:YqgE/AlgH family protein [Opitutaceae bacterium]